jgi:hypothetical protein
MAEKIDDIWALHREPEECITCMHVIHYSRNGCQAICEKAK